jgi:hypothetical protein
LVGVVGLVVVGILETLLKALILSKSLNKCKLDSLAYSYGMRVFAYIYIKKLIIIIFLLHIKMYLSRIFRRVRSKIDKYKFSDVNKYKILNI